MPYLLLAGAILLEVMATVSLRLSDGFTKLVPSILVAVGYIGAFGVLSLVLKSGMGIGIAYGIWAACGIALIAIIGAVFLGDSLTLVQFGGIALVIGGVLALELGGAH